jgi:predicted  nucleic acid-binding Zn-ribbon protein
LIDEQDFKLITNPDYFNGIMGWQERRQELFKLSGHSMTDEEIIAGAPEFADLRDTVSGRSIDDARSAAQYALKKIKDEKKGIPIRIDEINRGLPEIYDLSADEWARQERLRDGVRQKIEDIDSRLADAQTIAQAHAGKLQSVEDIRARLRIREAEIKEEAGREIREAQNKIEDLRFAVDSKRRHIDNLNAEISDKRSVIDEFETKAPGWRTEFDEIMATEFVEPTERPACSLCGQPLPAEMAAKDIGELRRDFYEQRDAKAAEIQARGKNLKAKADRAAEDIKSYQKAIDDAKIEIAGIEKQIADLQELANQDIPKIIPLEDDEYTNLMAAYKTAEADAKKTAKSGTVEDLLHDKRILQDSLASYDKKLASRAQREAAMKRINELKDQEKDLAAKVVAQEKIINLIEKFISYKSGLIEERINAMFPTARFRLFDTQINGGIVDCCDCMIGGVPYADANNAAKINAGLEIIDVISRARGITAPIFIDNRESVNELYRTGAQVINLIVSKDKALRVETSKSKSEEVA